MIDLKQELQDYHVINLNDISQNEADIPDNIRNSIFLYNKAIESLRTGSEDIAIIELKKAISMNPHFYEAINLLGICYGYINDNVRATEAFDRVIKAEQNSVKALRYMSLLNSGEVDGMAKSKARKRNSTVSIYNWIKYTAFFITGILLAILIQTIALKPEKIEESQTDNSVVKIENTSDEYKIKYEELASEYEQLQKDRDSANKAVDYYKSVLKLYEIESLASKKQFEKAADMLLLIRTDDFIGDDKVKYDNLFESVMPSAAWVTYDEGYKLYNTKKYQDSLKKLEKVEVYDPEFKRLDAVLYYMGRCYQLLNDSRNAVAIFQRLIDSFQDSKYATNAKVRLKALTQVP